MRQAREEGHSWAAIGQALNMSKQGAWDTYKRSIENQEKFVCSSMPIGIGHVRCSQMTEAIQPSEEHARHVWS